MNPMDPKNNFRLAELKVGRYGQTYEEGVLMGPVKFKEGTVLPTPDWAQGTPQARKKVVPMSPAKVREAAPDMARNLQPGPKGTHYIQEDVRFRSVDGEEYTFAKMKDPSNPIVNLTTFCRTALIALAEVAKGGNPATVMRAFITNISDKNGKVFFDRDQDYTEFFGSRDEEVDMEDMSEEAVDEEPDEEEDLFVGFTTGESQEER